MDFTRNMTSPRVCELCDREASVYCASDAAFLCSECDGRVHGANFLVARHVRHRLCSRCQGLAAADAGNRNPRPICNSCSPETFPGDGGDTSSESSEASSACISSTESLGTKSGFENRRKSESSVTEISGKVSDTPARLAGQFTAAIKKNRNRVQRTEVRAWMDAKAERTFVVWCNKLGLNCNSTAGVVSSASKALTFCLGRLTGVPLRVSLAASFWFGLRLSGDRALSTCQNLRRVEEASGVPAKLILAVEARLGRELRIRHARRDDLEEGWAEC